MCVAKGVIVEGLDSQNETAKLKPSTVSMLPSGLMNAQWTNSLFTSSDFYLFPHNLKFLYTVSFGNSEVHTTSLVGVTSVVLDRMIC